MFVIKVVVILYFQVCVYLNMVFFYSELLTGINTLSDLSGFFIPGFPKLLRYQQHHDKILEKFLPKLKKHLERNCIDSGLYTLKWFFQCFLDRVSPLIYALIHDNYVQYCI